LLIDVAAKGEQDSAASAGVTSLGKTVHPLNCSVAHVIAKQCSLRKLVVRCQGAKGPLKKGPGIQKGRGNFKYEKMGKHWANTVLQEWRRSCMRNASKAKIDIFTGACKRTSSILKILRKEIIYVQIYASTGYRLNFTDFRIIIKISK
jgi:hypothetical protein